MNFQHKSTFVFHLLEYSPLKQKNGIAKKFACQLISLHEPLAITSLSLYKPASRAERQGMPSRSVHNLFLEECEMPKLKTKSSAKKRFRLTGSGKVRGNVALKQHGMSKRPQKMKRKARGTMILCPQDARIVKTYMPNV